MATRFYLPGNFPSGAAIAAPVSPPYDAGWEQTGQALRFFLPAKNKKSVSTGISKSITVPITTTQDILNQQHVSEPIPPQIITGSVSLSMTCSESAATINATLAVVVKVVSQDGSVTRGTLFSVFGTDTEFALSASQASRIINNQNVTTLTTQTGDRLVVETGVHAAAPSTAGTAANNYIDNTASDLPLTSGDTTNVNGWIEFSQDLFIPVPNNYQFIKAPDGMSVSEKIR